jgi:alkanesulfonate monooxygenase SsuD/methylene tetrahydromethanopterin reductase-like flavin-dependent oxidoreductase (luciferase family)
MWSNRRRSSSSKAGTVMKFAHFSHVWGKPGMSPAERYRQLWRELQLCDELGFNYGFCVEHHFRPDESWMSAPTLYTVAAGARTKQIRLGAMGHIVPLHNPVRLVEEIAIADQMLEGRLDIGLVPGIVPDYFKPFNVDFQSRREVTLDFVRFLKAAFKGDGAFDYEGQHLKYKNVQLAVPPVQRPHPPMWIETRDPATLDFCAREGINAGYFFFFPRADAVPRYRNYLKRWDEAGWKHKPNVAYLALVYVDETDEKAMKTAFADTGRAYRGFLPPDLGPAELRAAQEERAKTFEERGEPGAADILRNLLNPDYLVKNELVLIGSPATVAKKLKQFAGEGLFNTFFGEFNFGYLAEADIMRSIRLFGTEVIPQLRDFQPF